MSTSGQHQFRYSQTPSKVLHLRNLPWECAEEELIELCRPFGKIVNTKCNVGANRNQAFVEFADLNQAITMVSYCSSSSELAQIRGKTVYIQYSNRNEIVNNKGPCDAPGNVLLVTFEGVEAGDISIDVIHMVFSAYGFVLKIATFEKAAGYQALVQYTDAQTAFAAREALDGGSIPRYLLPQHVHQCHLRISYSAHTDLNIKFQSHRSRDYTNPYLPVNPTAIEGYVQPIVGADGKKKEPKSNVLLASIENMQYAVTVDILHSIFHTYGTVQKIAIFEKSGATQALIQYPDVATATLAKDALEGHCIYVGGYCKLHLTFSRHTDLNVKTYSDKSRDFTVPESGLLAAPQASSAFPATVWQNTQSDALHPGGGFVADGSVQAHPSVPHVSSWDPMMRQQQQAGRSNFAPVPSTYPGQPYASSPAPAYTNAVFQSSSPLLAQTNQSTGNVPSTR